MPRWLRDALDRRRDGLDDDGGFTLVEVMVAMTVFAIFMAGATTAVIDIYGSTNQTQAIADAQSQLSMAFARLDREIRYASGISRPGAVGSDVYIEYRTTITGTPVCTELRLNNTDSQLQLRTWPQTSVVVPTPWTLLADGVAVSGVAAPTTTGATTVAPFTYYAPAAPSNFQRLGLSLASTSGGAGAPMTRASTVTFTALNSGLADPNPTLCTEGRSVP